MLNHSAYRNILIQFCRHFKNQINEISQKLSTVSCRQIKHSSFSQCDDNIAHIKRKAKSERVKWTRAN